ncbi:putative N-terminal acetyltransferase A, auxiliary subunit [Lyophyllum shimeji]|uniref:N-terminal acetyltransferase A, auxiliary subunit n=1 Tax=Lyophyllum shimeji TaxID=47721 RepID=A0A9P3PNK8_LYOSH|nr:putative N-terminal acetyltransferase A, auxiliary subunit [Lyophyllum shimeji]
MSKVLPTPAKRILPSKEATLFKELLTLYETRQLKKGLKTSDQILKKFPEHGETICMKGLILTHMGRREEGIDLVKKGVRLDLTSHICWHVFGLIQKGEKNYEEALKSYTQALRFDKENLNILRDAAQLQTQLRLFDGLVETRHTLLRIRPTLRQHWIALAVAYHLSGNLPEARKTLEHYERTLKNISDYDIEHSETLLYHIHLLEEMGEFTEALSLLDVNAKSRAIVDRTAIMETRARLLSKLGSDEAEHAWRALIEHNPECYDYYRGYLSNQGISFDSPSTEALETLRLFSTQLPKATAPRRLALNIATGDDFLDLVKPYLLSGLTKGIPSLFVDVKALYTDDAKRQVIEDIVETARADFSPESASPSSSSAAAGAEPTTYLWTLYFLAQHYSYLNRPKDALKTIEVALAHTPTLPELHTAKGRALKRAGDPFGAARAVDEARLLDGQDRFLNTKTAKYLLRAGLVDEASAILGLFTKKDAASPGADLEDMQSLLYLTEEADAHYRNGKLNLALKKYLAVQKIFNEIEDDQYDFHGYNLRKFTLNIYMKLIKWEDHLRSHPAYVKAALSASRIYVAVHDDPSIASAATSAPLTDAEKKAKKKAKKAAQKVQEDNKKAAAPSAHEDKGLEAGPAKDDDPEGLKLLSVDDPLERAAKLLQPLHNLVTDNIDVWIVIYDVAIRRKKFLQAVKALNHAHALDSEHPELHVRLVHFRQAFSALREPLPAPVGPLVLEALQKLLPDELSLDTYNSQYLQRHASEPRSVLAAAKVAQTLEAPLPDVEATVFSVLGPESKLDIPAALDIMSFLTYIKSERVEEFRSACDERFELSTVFKPAAELEALKKWARAGEEGFKDESEAKQEDVVSP